MILNRRQRRSLGGEGAANLAFDISCFWCVYYDFWRPNKEIKRFISHLCSEGAKFIQRGEGEIFASRPCGNSQATLLTIDCWALVDVILLQVLEERLSVTAASTKALDRNLTDITKKRKKAQAELEASRSVLYLTPRKVGYQDEFHDFSSPQRPVVGTIVKGCQCALQFTIKNSKYRIIRPHLSLWRRWSD